MFELEPRTWGWPDDVAQWLEWHGKMRAGSVQYACACTKLVDGACSVYAQRPKVCQDFPVGGDGCLRMIKERRPEQAQAILDLIVAT